MKVKFIDPKRNLPPSLISLGYSSNADFHLKEGEEYQVFGISIWKNVIHYLIVPSNLSLPWWLPADLFDITDQSLSSKWYFKYLGEDHPSGITIKIGYQESVLDDSHDLDLIEREVSAIRIFLERKHEIETDEET